MPEEEGLGLFNPEVELGFVGNRRPRVKERKLPRKKERKAKKKRNTACDNAGNFEGSADENDDTDNDLEEARRGGLGEWVGNWACSGITMKKW